ncbi:hypothetical protein B296_00039350 [Ensete ventricosum]|uniref:Uncharacterized protein n=1 Tax=Ensete ventricosum TaxID=4639 RepID=A0A426YDL3_ENSVE|nr:hypothetical protein B296_00039350 [Ensete ventricosum]
MERSTMTSDARSNDDKIIIEALGGAPVALRRSQDLLGDPPCGIRGDPPGGLRSQRAEGQDLPSEAAKAESEAAKGTEGGGGDRRIRSGAGSGRKGEREGERDGGWHRGSNGVLRKDRGRRAGGARNGRVVVKPPRRPYSYCQPPRMPLFSTGSDINRSPIQPARTRASALAAAGHSFCTGAQHRRLCFLLLQRTRASANYCRRPHLMPAAPPRRPSLLSPTIVAATHCRNLIPTAASLAAPLAHNHCSPASRRPRPLPLPHCCNPRNCTFLPRF